MPEHFDTADEAEAIAEAVRTYLDTDDDEFIANLTQDITIALNKMERQGIAIGEQRAQHSHAPALQRCRELLHRIKLRTPADGCVVCRHKDREHLPTCMAESCYCQGFVGVAEIETVRRVEVERKGE